LLNDILEFDSKRDGEFYCIQPLVVKKDKTKLHWRVVDGQQRLTTIYLTLKVLEESSTFSIVYEREEDIDNPKENTIEGYYLIENKKIIQNWIDAHSSSKDDIRNNILNRTKFIWYDIDLCGEADEYSMFRNLNRGKISLNNAELIKALFLKNIPNEDESNSERSSRLYHQSLIAEEYDQIEHRLREKDFWYFLNKRELRPSCIEFIFDLMYDTDEQIDGNKKKQIDQTNGYRTYNYFEWIITQDETNQRVCVEDQYKKCENVWEKVQTYFHVLEGWYADSQIYNLIGYMSACGYSVADIYREFIDNCNNKAEFIKRLKNECLKQSGWDITQSENSEYYTNFRYDDGTAYKLLLLFNIASLNCKATQDSKDSQSETPEDKKARKDKLSKIERFSFSSFHQCGWNVEHISPNNAIYYKELKDTDLMSKFNNEDWSEIELCKKGSNKKLKDLKDTIGEEKFNILNDYVSVNDESIMTILNLTLLNEHDNKSVGNKSFKEKRQNILSFMREGYFVPTSTQMVFTKGYTEDLNKDKIDFWSQEDRNNYFDKIKTTINEYFKEEI